MFLSGFSLRDKKDESSSEYDVVSASSSVSYSRSSIWSSDSSFSDKIRLWLFPFLEKFLAWNWNWNNGFLVECGNKVLLLNGAVRTLSKWE